MGMRTRIAIFACLLAGMTAACSGPGDEQALLARAGEALQAGEIDAALLDIKTVLQQEPDNATARTLLGDSYLLQRQAAPAAAEFLRAHRVDGGVESLVRYARALAAAGDTETLLALDEEQPPEAGDAPLYHAALARAQALAGNFRSAREALQRASALDGDDPYVRASEALLLLREGGSAFDAADILARITTEHPGNAEAWSLRADVARFQRDYASAAAWYRKAAEINPFRIAERLHRIGALIELGENDTASAELADLEALEITHPGVNFARGRLLVDEGRYADAVAELNQVLALLPEHGATLYLAATANLRQDNLATAKHQLIKLGMHEPANVPARLQLASVYLRQDDARAAEDVARDILWEDSDNVAAMRVLALALVNQGEYEESERLYQKLATLSPDSADDRTALGATRLLLGETEAGAEALQEALAMDPGNARLRERLIAIHLATGDIGAARELLAAYRANAEDETRPQIFAARVALQTGDAQQARDLFESVLARDPGHINANGGLAVMALAAQDLDTARTHFEAVLEAHPDHVQTLMNLATLEERAGNTDAMVTALKRAVKADPQALRPRLAYARYRSALGDARGAITLLNEVRETHGDSYELHRLLATAYLAAGETTLAASGAGQMLRLRPADPETLALAARIEYRDGQLSAAREHGERVLESEPGNVGMRRLVIETLLAQDMPERAAEQLPKLPAAVRDSPQITFIEGRLALTLDRPEDAEPLFRKVFDAYPTGRHLLFLGTAMWLQDKHGEAIRNLEDWLREHPDDHPVRNELAAWQFAVGNEAAAGRHYRMLLDAGLESPQALNTLAWLNRETSPDRALEYARRAHELAPDSVPIIDTYAMVQRSLGNIEEALALSELANAGEKNPSPELQYNRALILIDADREKEAIDILAALVTGPEFAQQAAARTLLGQMLSN